MSTNVTFEDFDGHLSVECTQPAVPASGDPVLFGDRAGVALTAERADGRTTVLFECVAEIPVKGINGSGNVAVAAGDVLYYTAGNTPPVSKLATGSRYGVAMSRPGDTAGANLIASGATGTIRVFVGL